MGTKRNGFSVLERLVVVAIILGTLAIVMPDLLRSKGAPSAGSNSDQHSLRRDSK
jgi:type II secretory pathway pseudopilin PulG